MTSADNSRSEIADFSKQLVSRLAPEELDFFDELEANFQRDPRPYKPASVEEDPLQFGLHDAAPLITPAAIAATTAVFHYLGSIFSEVTKNVASTLLKERVGRILSSGSHRLLVKPEQLEEVRRMARHEALKYGVTESIADAMADDIVRSLHA